MGKGVVMTKREFWLATSWWTSRWGWRWCGFFCCAFGCEAIWGAVKFDGGWKWAYGAFAAACFAFGAAFLMTANGRRR